MLIFIVTILKSIHVMISPLLKIENKLFKDKFY